MEPGTFKSARVEAGLTQHEAAARLGLSQPYYSQLESGFRRVPARLVNKLVEVLPFSPLDVPLPALTLELPAASSKQLAAALANLGYPGFAHLRTKSQRMNPALLVAQALAQGDLDVRVIEGLPWLLTAFSDLDWKWLVSQCRLLNLQNKLGFLVELAAQLGKSPADQKLRDVLSALEASRLATEGTLCDDSMNAVERAWTASNRPALATRWNLLTTLALEDLNHAA